MTQDFASPAVPAWRIEPLGDRALIIAFESRVDPDINRAARAAAERLLAHPIDGVVDVVPTFCTVAVFYRPERIAADAQAPAADGFVSPYARLSRRIEALLAVVATAETAEDRLVEVPVCYGGVHGPDLPEVAAACGLTPAAVVDAHIASPHLVYMLGFSPGFPYIGGLDPRLELPRRATPRTRIPAGTVAIARDQTAIYSVETPGGWNLIGRTPLRLFDAAAVPPCLLRPGDRLRFVPIDATTYRSLADRAAQ